jgi:hypothetical protein
MSLKLDKRVRFTKTAAGKWGVNGPSDVCRVGAAVEVLKRDGSTSRVKIVTTTPARPGYVDCTIESIESRSKDSAGNSISTGASYRAGVTAPGARRCPRCGGRECARAWSSHDLCDED